MINALHSTSPVHYAKAYYADHEVYLTSSALPDFPIVKTVRDAHDYVFYNKKEDYTAKDCAVFTKSKMTLLTDMGAPRYVDPRFDNTTLFGTLTGLVLTFWSIKIRQFLYKPKLSPFFPYQQHYFHIHTNKLKVKKHVVKKRGWKGFLAFTQNRDFLNLPQEFYHSIYQFYYKKHLYARSYISKFSAFDPWVFMRMHKLPPLFSGLYKHFQKEFAVNLYARDPEVKIINLRPRVLRDVIKCENNEQFTFLVSKYPWLHYKHKQFSRYFGDVREVRTRLPAFGLSDEYYLNKRSIRNYKESLLKKI